MAMSVDEYKKMLDNLTKREQEIPKLIDDLVEKMDKERQMAEQYERARLDNLHKAEECKREKNSRIRSRSKLNRERGILKGELSNIPGRKRYYEIRIKQLSKPKEEPKPTVTAVKKKDKGKGIAELGDVFGRK
jgi:chromosome segregation ATPase